MLRRSSWLIVGVLFWLSVLVGGSLWFLHEAPKHLVTVQTGTTPRYEVAVFLSPNPLGGQSCSVYARPRQQVGEKEWRYIMAYAPVKRAPRLTAWTSADGNKVLVAFPDRYFASNLKTAALEKYGPVSSGSINSIKRQTGISSALSFSKPHQIGSWKWQDADWKDVLRVDPQYFA